MSDVVIYLVMLGAADRDIGHPITTSPPHEIAR